MKVYLVEGMANTDLEGMVFAVCTTLDKAKSAMSKLFDGEDLKITEVIADTIRTDDQIVPV